MTPARSLDPTAGYRAATESVAVFDLSDRAQIEITGGDRAKFLHNFCTNDIKRLQPGEGCEAFVTNVKGRVLGHVFVFVGPESIWLDSSPGTEESLLAHLGKYVLIEDVELHARSASQGELLLSGPSSESILRAAGLLPEPLALFGHRRGGEVAVRRTDLLGLPGYVVSASRERIRALRASLIDAGAHPAGPAALNALRIEAGLPLYGVDVSEDQLAQEVGRTARAISFTKGCYLGQEPIARIDAMGHVNRELRGLRLATDAVPEAGDRVVGADGKEIGAITSAALSYRDNRSVVLAYLRAKFTAPGTPVSVVLADARVPAEVFWPLA